MDYKKILTKGVIPSAIESARKNKKNQEPKENRRKPKQIKETKCTCSSCGHIWYYGKQEIAQSCGESMENCGKAMSCCSGCAPAAFLPDKKPIDLNKCPECGSRAIKKEEIIHNIE